MCASLSPFCATYPKVWLVCCRFYCSICFPFKDYLIVSPLWTFKKSWVYCGHATTLTALTHTSVCDKMAVAFRETFNNVLTNLK